MPELPRQSNSADDHLAREREIEPQDAALYDLISAQGFALRRTLYECTAAIVAAMREVP